MNNTYSHEQGPVSVDGCWFALVDGAWTHVPATGTSPAVAQPPIPKGYLSIDGAWFRNIEGRLEPTSSPFPPSPSPPIPDGYVSVDGALLRVTPDA